MIQELNYYYRVFLSTFFSGKNFTLRFEIFDIFSSGQIACVYWHRRRRKPISKQRKYGRKGLRTAKMFYIGGIRYKNGIKEGEIFGFIEENTLLVAVPTKIKSRVA